MSPIFFNFFILIPIKFSLIACLISLMGLPVHASPQEGTNDLAEIIVSSASENDLRLKKEEITRVETLNPQKLQQKKQAQTFAQIISNEKGIDAQMACAFCGAKRITINGMKGEHTTLLVDGLPLHSTVSSFYGVEAIPLGGLDSIDIYRGSGAALTTPEAIGGAINLVTKEIITNSIESDISWAHDGQRNFSLLGTRKLSFNTGVLLGLQYGEILPLDLDNNGISELPRQTTQSVISKLTHSFNADNELSLRISYAKLNNIGGSMSRTNLSSAATVIASPDEFRNRDVRQQYLGDITKVTDNVDLERIEVAAIHRWQIDTESSLKLSLGGAWQNQEAIYSHGYDYDNKDKMWVGVLEYQRTLGDRHLLTLGLDSKNQDMDSSSKTLYIQSQPPLPQDDLSYKSIGGFVQDTWFINDENQLSLVLRYDHIRTEWKDINKVLDRSVLAPRFIYKHNHNSIFTSRLSAGLGYRSPLTLFESQHGTYHNGFIVDINELERAKSLTYSLAGQRENDFFEFGSHITRIKNMAYGKDFEDITEPMVFKNSTEDYTINVFDLSYGRRIRPNWTLEGLMEFFQYPSGYKYRLPVAAIEKRISINSNIDWKKWTASQRFILIGSRDLSSYRYDRHYNIAPSQDPFDPSFGEDGQDPKWQKAPTFFTVDLSFERTLNDDYKISFAVLNALDYTQTQAGDSPTTWEQHGSHFHLDNFHIWGPLRGRQFFVSLRGNF